MEQPRLRFMQTIWDSYLHNYVTQLKPRNYNLDRK